MSSMNKLSELKSDLEHIREINNEARSSLEFLTNTKVGLKGKRMLMSNTDYASRHSRKSSPRTKQDDTSDQHE